jgi:hypothetical protein
MRIQLASLFILLVLLSTVPGQERATPSPIAAEADYHLKDFKFAVSI